MTRSSRSSAHDATALSLKAEIEPVKCCELLLKEIKVKKVPAYEDDDMVVDIMSDLSEESLSGYDNYSKEVHSQCKNLIDEIGGDHDDILDRAITIVTGQFTSIPKYT